jgi:hypothetical protein
MAPQGYWQELPQQNTLRPLDVIPGTTPIALDLNTLLQVITVMGICVVIGMLLMKRDK